jgi:hypothetical protein
MDFKSPNAFCALAITVFASCAKALPPRDAMQIATTASFFTASPLNQRLLVRPRPSWLFYIDSASRGPAAVPVKLTAAVRTRGGSARSLVHATAPFGSFRGRDSHGAVANRPAALMLMLCRRQATSRAYSIASGFIRTMAAMTSDHRGFGVLRRICRARIRVSGVPLARWTDPVDE